MELLFQVIAILAVVIGTSFSVIGVLGYFRLPDVYARLHTVGMVSTFGVVLLLVTAAIRTPVSWGHALVLILFLLVAGPPTAHSIASAAHRIGLKRKEALRDDLADEINKTDDQPSE
jgi:multicomponent Na+:H+ antiporter subunit G